jgi:hypothetical protein
VLLRHLDHRREIEGAVDPHVVASHRSGGEVGLDRVHVAVRAAVVGHRLPVARSLLDAATGGVVPEVAAVDLEGPREQILAARDPGARGRAARQDDEGVLVAGFGVVDRSVVADRAVPAAVERIAEVGQQGTDPVAARLPTRGSRGRCARRTRRSSAR